VIRVVAASRLHGLPVDGSVVLRSSRLQPCVPQALLDARSIRSLDADVTTVQPDTIEQLANDLVNTCNGQTITYVTAGSGAPGDAILEAVPARYIGEVYPGTPDRGSFGLGACQLVDALALAVAECRRPYDRGLVPIDPTVPLVVTNWYGDDIVGLATTRLTRIYGAGALPEPTPDFELPIPALEHLSPSASIAELEQITARLRRKDGCPWDREQTRESLFPQFQEELEELGAAIRHGDTPNMQEELGDVLFHVVAQCQLAVEAGEFTLDDVVRGITAKLVRRHPHVFGDESVDSVDDVLATWQRVKQEEKSAAGEQRVD
jgi:NTP pyrophosphatase (non-canonical NTP hydrolase)